MPAPEYRVHIVYDVPRWAYHHRAEALASRAPPNIRVTSGTQLPEPQTLDLVLLLDFHRSEELARQLAGAGVVLLVSVNVGWPEHRERISRAREQCDALLFNNRHYYRSFIELHGPDARWHQISNGVDTTIFRSRGPVEQRPPRVLWTGSKLAADNKGYELLRALAPDIRALGLELDLRLVDSMDAPWTLEQMADWYHSGQILLVASRTEGTPNPALEAAACGVVVVATAVGNIPELIVDGVDGVIVEREPASILAGVRRAQAELRRLSEAMAAKIPAWSWDRRADEFFTLFTELIDDRRRA